MKNGFGRQRKLVSFSIFLFAILFYIFFNITKHVPSLAEINPFAVDPYDAVGSFGVQLALFTAVMAVVRAIRPYTGGETIAFQEELILRSEKITVLSIIVTLGADIVSMIRSLSVWLPSTAGRSLAWMVGGMVVATGIAVRLITHDSDQHFRPISWKPAAAICSASLLILAVYPSRWDESIPGGVGTAVLGMLLFFISVWTLSVGTSLEIHQGNIDFFDDLDAIYVWLKVHLSPAKWLFQMAENLTGHSWIRPLFDWMNPRKHRWNWVMVAALTMGLALAAAEAVGEGISPIPGRFMIVISVFIGIEGAGILIGYALLGRYLGIYRSIKSV